MTEAELRLWIRLRGEQIGGHRFRRQAPVGPYFVDFACLKARLVVELDGGQHATARDRDERRTAWLESRGFKMLRFWNTDVLENPNGVLENIRAALTGTPTPTLRSRGREIRIQPYAARVRGSGNGTGPMGSFGFHGNFDATYDARGVLTAFHGNFTCR